MVSTAQILSKRKRVSKKSKKAWRKHTDIRDVEKFLEDRLREERTGGNPADKKNEDLFYIDKSDLFQSSKTKLSNMKCHSELQIDTRVAPVSGYSGPSKKKTKKTNPHTPVTQPSPNTKPGPVYDIWGTPAPTPDPTRDPCLQPLVQPPVGYKRSEGTQEAVELPHPGASYNPTFTEHQELLTTALEVEEKREKAKAKATRDAAPPIKITEEDYIREMSIGLNPNETTEEPEEQIESESERAVPGPVPCERKTKSQRNKEKAEKEKRKDLALSKEKKRIAHQLNRIKAIKKEIRKDEHVLAEKSSKTKAKNCANFVRAGKFGPGKMMDPQPDFLLPEEVSSSLRQLISTGDPLQDRFSSLQKRNMVEVRKKVVAHRKYKVKQVEKWRRKLPEELDELVRMKRRKNKKIKMSED